MDAMHHLRDGELHVEEVPLSAVAERFGTPTYVYSRAMLEARFRAFGNAFAGAARPPLVCYAVKANPNLAILDLFVRLGSGFDIVSGGELARVIAAGGDPGRTVFSGVGKSESEMRMALEAGILCFNIESIPELERLARVAATCGRVAPVSIRVNPDVDPRTHPYITTGLEANKFGVSHRDAPALYRAAVALDSVRITGIDCHIGSQITETGPYTDALARVLAMVDRLQSDGIALEHIDLGGGLGIRYDDETPPGIDDYARALLSVYGDRPQRLVFEPGRWLVGNAGLLLTRVEYLKPGASRNFAIVDAAMNDLMRPSLYEAWHPVQPVRPVEAPAHRYDIVGPVCESGDWLARDRELAIASGDLLAIGAAGAYGMSMSSNYNTRPRAAEVMIDGGAMHEVRARERIADLYAHESRLP
jgi:diaminopimelate decarboxylase